MMIWNRCDYCGRFIALQQFADGDAQHTIIAPDSLFSDETYDTYHVACADAVPEGPQDYATP